MAGRLAQGHSKQNKTATGTVPDPEGGFSQDEQCRECKGLAGRIALETARRHLWGGWWVEASEGVGAKGRLLGQGTDGNVAKCHVGVTDRSARLWPGR